MKLALRHPLLTAIAAVALVGVSWAGFAPVKSESREAYFEIPKGTWARRMSGTLVDILPQEIHLTLGLRNVLVLRNMDEVPQIFGPTLLMPGQSLQLPFEVASTYTFACTAHVSGQMTIVVHPRPATPWSRVGWRIRQLLADRRA
jgi:hypothetical protein